ncbi:MAG: RHS repeat-associated core domain-containing protein, partial [Planctomycetota bacterium]
MRDDNGVETHYAYDALKRLTSVQLSDGSLQSITYDAAGNPLQVLQPNGTTISNQFSPANRLTTRQIARATDILGEVFENYQYDGLGRCVSMASDISQLQFTFDSLSRVTQELQDGKAVASTFDPAGNRTSLTYPGGRTVQTSFDTLERMVALKDSVDSTELASFAYIGQNRLSSTRNQNGTSMRVLYDQVPRPETIINSVERDHGQRKKTEVFGGFQYIYDREGNQKAEIRIRGDSKSADGYRLGDGDLYRYDSAYRLTKATFDVDRPLVAMLNPSTCSSDGQVTYNLDGVDNWLSTIRTEERNHGRSDRPEVTNYAINELNQVTAVNAKPLTYDRNGSRTRDSKFRYAYNYRGQLIQATRRLSRSRNLDVTFRYDPLGRRIGRTIGVTITPPRRPQHRDDRDDDDDRSGDGDDDDDPPLSKASSTRLYYDGQRVIEEQDSRGRTLRTFVHGNGLATPLSMDVASDDPDCDWWDDDPRGRRHAPKRFFFHRNVQGSISHVTDKKGRVVEAYSYDAYGVPSLRDLDDRCKGRAHAHRSAFISRIGNPYLYVGQRFDPTLGLYDMRARDYDSTLGRFLQRDPIGQFGGINLYAYCGSNPVNFIDPLGLNRTPFSLWDTFGDLVDAGVSLWLGAQEAAMNFVASAIQAAVGVAVMTALVALATSEIAILAPLAALGAAVMVVSGLVGLGTTVYEILTGTSWE